MLFNPNSEIVAAKITRFMRHFRLAVRTSEKLVEGEMLNEPAPALFQQQWQLYRKFVDNNYFYHREVYGQLHRILVEEAVPAVPVPGYRLW
jgi:hypothetical protein